MERIAMPGASPVDIDRTPEATASAPPDAATVAIAGTLLDRIAGEPVWRLPDGRLRIVSSFEKEGWVPRQEERREGFDDAGSCISFQGGCWEVRAIVRDEEGSGFVYTLTPWDPAFPIRQLHPHDEAHHGAEKERRATQLRESLFIYPALLACSPLLGLLPGRLQTRIELRYGMGALRMTVLAALLTFVSGSALVVTAVAALPEPLGLGFLLGLYLAVESLMRWRTAWIVEEPMGTAFIVVPYTAWEVLRDVVHHERRRRRGDPRELSASRQAAIVARLDLVQPAPGGGIVVQSYFPKSWSDRVTIGVDGRFYTLRERSESPSTDGMVFRYVFDPASMDEVLRSVTPYRPDEGLRELLVREQEAKADRLNMVAPLLALLPARLQERFEAEGYMPRRAVQASSLIFGLGAVLQIWVSLSIDPEHPLAQMEVVACLYLLGESAYRLYRVLYGEITGSILGLPLGILLELWSGSGERGK